MNQLQKVFQYNESQVRTVVIDGEPWFVAKDVCEILEIADARQAVDRLDEDERCLIPVIDTLGRSQDTFAVNEPGLYTLVLGSRKSEAKTFKRWITHEVIPSIRKHGAYMTPQALEAALLNPDTMIKLLTNLKDEQERRKQAEQIIEEQRPKVLFAEAVAASKDCILIGELAKILRQNGVETGQNRLFKWLRQNGYMLYSGGENIPSQRAMELGLFEITKVNVQPPDGAPKIRTTVKVTPKGQAYFIRKLLKGVHTA